MKLSFLLPIVACWCYVAFAGKYVWPSEYDELEDILSLQTGEYARYFSEDILPCEEGGIGKMHAGDWLRTVFHDMITYNAEERTGGLDASIWLELDRPENSSRDFNETFADFRYLYTPKASAADLLAMAVVVVHSSCGGKSKIPFRYGRVDAKVAGPAGAPQQFQSVQTFKDRFATAGFSHEEMITMTACGHTLGGVHKVDPNDKPEDDEDEDGHDEDHEEEEEHEEDHDEEGEELEDFDSTPDTFDNRIAIEYLDGTTKNPLVISPNMTENSDHRIFSSDGNKTIAELASSNDDFKSRCTKLFNRMIDSVPSNVELSEPLEAVDIKPYILGLYLEWPDYDQLLFHGRVRVRTTPGVTTDRNPRDLTVRIEHASRDGEWSKTLVNSTYVGDAGGLYGETFAWYEFKTNIPSAEGISKFNIHTLAASTGNSTVYTNEGGGYPVDDSILYQRDDSCVSPSEPNGRYMRIVVTVPEDRASMPVRLDVNRFDRRQGTVLRPMRTESIPMLRTGERRGNYVVFQAGTEIPSITWSTTFDIVQEGEGGGRVDYVRPQECLWRAKSSRPILIYP